MRKRVVWVAAFILTISFTPEVHAFFESYGAGLRANAMGGAFTAVADDTSAVYYNPAGLAQLKNHKFSTEFLYYNPNFEVHDTATGEDLVVVDKMGETLIDPVNGTSSTNDLIAPVVGMAINVNKLISPLELPFNTQFGVVTGIGNGTGFKIAMIAPDLPHFLTIGDLLDHLNAYATLSMEIFEDLVYIGVGCAISIIGTTDVVGTNVYFGNDEPALFHGKMPMDLFLGNTFGILVTPFDKMVRIGFNYKEECKFEVTPLQLGGIFDAFGPNPSIILSSDILTNYRPTEYNFGIAVDLEKLPLMDDHFPLSVKHLLVSLDVCYRTWSEFQYDRSISYWLNYDNSPQLLPGTVTDPEFDDTMAYKFGIMYRLNADYSVMAGYQQYISPVPDQSHRATNYIDMDRNTYSLGGTYAFRKLPFTFSGFMSYTTTDSVYVDNTDANGNPIKGVSWCYEADPDITMASFEVPQSSIFALGFGATLTF